MTSLIRGDHDDLAHMLLALSGATTSPYDTCDLVEALHAGFSAHAAAQVISLRSVLGRMPFPRVLDLIVRNTIEEHRAQARALAALAQAPPAVARRLALDLRASLIDHAEREAVLECSLRDHVTTEAQRSLSTTYTSVRQRVRQLFQVTPRRAATMVGSS